MNAKERIKELAAERKITIAELERTLDIANGTIGKWNKQNPSIEPLNKLANFFGVTTDYLLGRTDTPQFTAKNERDVQKILTEMKEGLSNQHSLGYFKNDGEEIDEEDAEILAEALDFVVRQSKLIAKKKYTRKDYRKANHSDLDK